MAKTRQLKNATPYLQRLLEDEYVQDQLRDAISRVRQAYARASRQPKAKSVEDKKLYKLVRQAATSVSAVASAIGRKPEPKRRGRKALLIAALVGGGALLATPSCREKVRSLASRGSAKDTRAPASAPVADATTSQGPTEPVAS